MKITKSYLKQVIKEELSMIEGDPFGRAQYKADIAQTVKHAQSIRNAQQAYDHLTGLLGKEGEGETFAGNVANEMMANRHLSFAEAVKDVYASDPQGYAPFKGKIESILARK